MVRIVQCLCPSRHCIAAIAYVGTEPDPAVESMLRSQIGALGPINPWCGICKSRDLKFEDQPTKYATMDEARPHLEQNQREQMLTRAVLGQTGQN